LTVSGGVDSMVLLHLFCQLKTLDDSPFRHFKATTFGVAHCNFNLRGKESDSDEQHVKNIAQGYGIRFYSMHFQTEEYARENKLSIEMAARELRYNWFNELSDNYGYTCIATAHHKNDLAETFLINFSRGTGLKGLISLKPKNNNVIRPLLFATRLEIETYAQEYSIEYRTDQSNNEELYTRNKIRHSIVPVLENINPSFIDKASDTIEILREAYALYTQRVAEIKKDIISKFDIETLIAKHKLFALENKKTVLYEIISEFGFNESQVKQVLQWEHEEAGACVFSHTHELYNGRNYLHIADKEHMHIEETYNSLNELLQCKYCQDIKAIDVAEGFSIVKDSKIATFDIDKITFPITVRNWMEGDRMHPFGMKGSKKVSDILTDLKLSHKEKQHAKVLVSNNTIMWLIGIRASEKFKVTKKTKRVLQISV